MSSWITSSLLALVCAQDSVSIDAAGKYAIGGKQADIATIRKQIEEAKATALKITVDTGTRAQALIDLIKGSGVAKFEIALGDKKAAFQLPDKSDEKPKMIEELRVHVCWTDDYDGHLRNADHVKECTKPADSAYAWIGQNYNLAEEVNEKFAQKLASTVAKTLALVKERSRTNPPLILQVDPNISMKSLHLLLSALVDQGAVILHF